MNVFKVVGMHADGLVEQGHHRCHAEFCHLEHVDDGCGSYRRPDRSATTKCSVGHSGAFAVTHPADGEQRHHGTVMGQAVKGAGAHHGNAVQQRGVDAMLGREAKIGFAQRIEGNGEAA